MLILTPLNNATGETQRENKACVFSYKKLGSNSHTSSSIPAGTGKTYGRGKEYTDFHSDKSEFTHFEVYKIRCSIRAFSASCDRKQRTYPLLALLQQVLRLIWNYLFPSLSWSFLFSCQWVIRTCIQLSAAGFTYMNVFVFSDYNMGRGYLSGNTRKTWVALAFLIPTPAEVPAWRVELYDLAHKLAT